MTSAGDSTSNV